MDALQLTRDLLAFDTINPPGQEDACARHLAGLLEAAGFAVRAYQHASGRTSLVARIGGSASRPPLGFAGHIDTVPLGAAAWQHDPFAGETGDGRLYGRGASDMKSGVAAFVVAACGLAGRLAGTPGLELVIVAGEETGCDGSRHLVATPGALGAAGALVVGEPTGNQPLAGHKGALWLHGRTTGVTAHGSMPHHGVNAVYRAARAVTRLESFTFDAVTHPVLGAPTLNVGTINGGLNINSVPDAATIGIDLRTVPGQEHGMLQGHLSRYLGPEVVLDPVVDVPGVWTDPDDPWLQEVFELAASFLGERPAVRAAPYFTDASLLTPAYGHPPTVVLGPGEMAQAHQTNEYCRIDRIEQAVELYEAIVRRWCGV